MSDREIRRVLDEYTLEAVALRVGAKLPGAHATTETLLDSLLDVRQRLDRVEELLGNALRIRTEAHRQHTACRVVADDAWDQAAVSQRQSAVRDEYSSAKERTAYSNLEVLDLRRAERSAEQLVRVCDSAVEGIRLRHRGLADVRQDVLAIIKARQFESSLDR